MYFRQQAYRSIEAWLTKKTSNYSDTNFRTRQFNGESFNYGRDAETSVQCIDPETCSSLFTDDSAAKKIR